MNLYNIDLTDSPEQLERTLIGKTNAYDLFMKAIRHPIVANEIGNKDEIEELFMEAFRNTIAENSKDSIHYAKVESSLDSLENNKSYYQL